MCVTPDPYTSLLYNHQSNVHEEFSLKTVFTDVLYVYLWIYICAVVAQDVCAHQPQQEKENLNVVDGSPVTGSAKQSQFVTMYFSFNVFMVMLMHRFLSFHTSL